MKPWRRGLKSATPKRARPAGWLRTITFDNGRKFARHESVANALDVETYFADAYASYQRGCNENINGLLRQYPPKTARLDNLSKDDARHIVERLNNRPRKKPSPRIPAELLRQAR
ncbi:MAG: IS30 family transposase [Candidatus Hydrogenedentota bacterium]